MKNHSKNNSAILLCGHGSRSKTYSQNLTEIKKKVEKKIDLNVFNCFLEINKPTLEECLSKYSKKYDQIFVFPFLIFEGYHFKEDVSKLVEKYNKLKNIILIDKISLLDEILPIIFKILSEKIKKGKNTVLVTSSSYSTDESVLISLKKYTKALSKKLKLSSSFFHYVGNERGVIEKLKTIENDKLSVLLHPIFLFRGFLYKKNKKCFLDNFSKKVLITNSLANYDQIFEVILLKLVKKIFFYK